MSLFQKNLKLLLDANPRLAERENAINFSKAETIAEASNGEREISEWMESSKKAVVLPDYFPRQKVERELWEKSVSTYNAPFQINEILDVHEDLHLEYFALGATKIIESEGVQLDELISRVSNPVSSWICLGTGDGRALHWFFNNFPAFELTVVVSEWEEFVSSFYHLDWESVWSQYTDSNRSITLVRIEHISELIGVLIKRSLLLKDHSYVYLPNGSSPKLESFHDRVFDRRLHSLIPYAGYTIDEYNMIVNSADTLSASPKIYRKPYESIFDRIVVCGSGPSLDLSIDFLRDLSQDHIVIAGGSNYRTLVKNGIRVDCLLLVERADEVYDSYKSIFDDVGETNTKLLVSSTCNRQLFDLFNSYGVFFRPSLTPLSVFSDDKREIINNEGPQAVCAAVSMALDLKPSHLALVGIDFGSVDEAKERSSMAVGVSPHKWSLTYKGNFQDTVHTNSILMDCREVVEMRIRNASLASNYNTKVYNLSNGAFIDGTIPANISSYLQEARSNVNISMVNPGEVFEEWWSKLPYYTLERMRESWNSRRPRQCIYDFYREVDNIVNQQVPLYPTKFELLEKIIDYNQYPVTLQFASRIAKGSIYKYLLIIYQLLQYLRDMPELQDKIVSDVLDLFKHSLIQLEKESYSLCDYVENKYL